MSFTTLIFINLAVVLLALTLLWVVSVIRRDASIVDPCWGLGFVLIAWLMLLHTGCNSFRDGLLLGLTTVWGLRLSAYLFWRNHGKGEDRRYTQMRDKHGERFWWVSLFTVFLLQGVLMWFIALTIQSGMYFSQSGDAFEWIGWIGVVLWAVGLFFETVGDYQMAVFKSRPESEGKVMDQGLWRYTRHPNYFGDFCIWWGLFLVAAMASSWWTILGPLLMSFLLIKVSGVAMLEGDIEERRPEYARYKKKTSPFFPMPPSSDTLGK